MGLILVLRLRYYHKINFILSANVNSGWGPLQHKTRLGKDGVKPKAKDTP